MSLRARKTQKQAAPLEINGARLARLTAERLSRDSGLMPDLARLSDLSPGSYASAASITPILSLIVCSLAFSVRLFHRISGYSRRINAETSGSYGVYGELQLFLVRQHCILSLPLRKGWFMTYRITNHDKSFVLCFRLTQL